ncbi:MULTISPECIES: hypothetical protein [Delftia]|uniref:hypothetical protein n=1 Tax=Delftia TaxID=80865 RepID=UPI0018D86397|nr:MULTISPECIES: hypothetical protein [Delftia]QPS73467.1 hypothetical protein I6G48_22855 [Delftia acidovorans]
MGEAKRRGSRQDRIDQAKIRPEVKLKAGSIPDLNEIIRLKNKAGRLNDAFNGLTTPSSIDENVKIFAQKIGGKDPIFLECQPELWSRQSCCDSNVLEYIKTNGGRMLCGYRIWYTPPRYIEGERHAVWTDGTNIRDVSFVDTGEEKTVFVADEHAFADAPRKVRLAFGAEDKQALEAYERLESHVPIGIMSPEKAWETSITYAQWLEGKRMPNLIPGFLR